MTWIQTHSGREFFFDGIKPDSINLGDIAHSLALTNRFNGHTIRAYSVAEHSVRVAVEVLRYARAGKLAEHQARDAALCGLLHDAAEAYTGDIVSPLKSFIEPGDALRGIIAGIEKAVEESLLGHIQPEHRSIWHRGYVKRADLALLAAESASLFAGGRVRDWPVLGGVDHEDARSPEDALDTPFGVERHWWAWEKAFLEMNGFLRSDDDRLPKWVRLENRSVIRSRMTA